MPGPEISLWQAFGWVLPEAARAFGFADVAGQPAVAGAFAGLGLAGGGGRLAGDGGQVPVALFGLGSPPDLGRDRLDGAGLAGEDGRMADAAPGPGKLAGRDRELAALRRWLARARARHGRLAVLAGPPGTGRTRLTEELAGRPPARGRR